MSIFDKSSQLKKHQMFFGDGHFIQEFLEPAYPWALKSADRQNSQDWAWDEFPLKLDAAQLSTANNAIRHIFTSNLQSQIFADTVQGRGPSWLVPYISDPSLEAAFAQWSRFEILHSRTYTNILTSMYPNPRIVLDMIEQKPEVFSRFSQCVQAYDDFFEHPTKENFVILIAAINILEGLSFYASFICNFAFANMGLFESVAKYLKLIARDEALHLSLTQQIIKNWRTGKDGKEWKDIWNRNKDRIREMYVSAIHEEYQWSKYLFQYGTPIVGLNEDVLNRCIDYYANKRMKNIGLKEYNSVNKDPLPWVQTKYLSNSGFQDAPQEVSIVAYLKGSVSKVEDMKEITDLFKEVELVYPV